MSRLITQIHGHSDLTVLVMLVVLMVLVPEFPSLFELSREKVMQTAVLWPWLVEVLLPQVRAHTWLSCMPMTLSPLWHTWQPQLMQTFEEGRKAAPTDRDVMPVKQPLAELAAVLWMEVR